MRSATAPTKIAWSRLSGRVAETPGGDANAASARISTKVAPTKSRAAARSKVRRRVGGNAPKDRDMMGCAVVSRRSIASTNLAFKSMHGAQIFLS
jgi:hypothetical protein